MELDSTEKKGRSEILQLVGFKLGNEEFGIDILVVQEINRMLEITQIPQSVGFVEGVINLRGKVIPIINLRKRFGMPEKEEDKSARIVVANINGKVIGMVVDEVSEVLRLPVDTVEPPPSMVSGVDSQYIKGVGKIGKKLLILLDLDKLLSSQEHEMLEYAAK